MGKLKDRLLEDGSTTPPPTPIETNCCKCGWDFTVIRRETRVKLRYAPGKVICDECNRQICDAQTRRREERVKARPQTAALKDILNKLGIKPCDS